MRLVIQHFYHPDPSFERKVDQNFAALNRKMEIMMAALDTLETDLNANTDVVNSAVTLIQTLAQEIKDAGTDPVKLKALTDKLEANTQALAEAVSANTPSQPTE